MAKARLLFCYLSLFGCQHDFSKHQGHILPKILSKARKDSKSKVKRLTKYSQKIVVVFLLCVIEFQIINKSLRGYLGYF